MHRSTLLALGIATVLVASGCGESHGSEGTTRPVESDAASEPVALDSGTIAYQDGYDQYASVWMIQADGSGAHGTAIQGSAPDWSPDGEKIAVGADSIQIYTPTGRLLRSIWGPYEEPAWSPDGRTIAFTGNDISASGPDYSDIHLWLLNLATGKLTRFAEDVGFEAVNPSWSPDGKRLMFASYGAVLIAGVKTRSYGGFGVGVVSGAWSPQGNAIAYSTGHTIVVSRADGTGRHTIATSKDWLDQPAWSPDGKHIAYVVLGERGLPETSRGLRVIDADGTRYRVLTDSGSHPDWQPR